MGNHLFDDPEDRCTKEFVIKGAEIRLTLTHIKYGGICRIVTVRIIAKDGAIIQF